MTQKDWKATLAPIGVVGSNGRIIDPSCRVTVLRGSSLWSPDRAPLGRVEEVSIKDNYIVVMGKLLSGVTIPPDVFPTFDGGPCDEYLLTPVGEDESDVGILTLHTLEIISVRTGFIPVWDDSAIRFN